MATQLEKTVEDRDELRRRVNVNIQVMFEKTVKWHDELMRKKE